MADSSAPAADAPETPEAAVKRPSPLKRPGVRLALLAVAAILVVLLMVWFVRHQSYGRFQQSTDDAYLRADAVTVSPRISGYVEQVYVRDNQDVRAGQPLVRIDPRDYRAQASQADAQIRVAEASVANVRATIAEQRAAIMQAAAQLAAAEHDARFAASEVARYAPLAASGAETRERLATLRNQAAQAEAQAAAQRAALTIARRRIGSLGAQIAQGQAQRAAAEAQREAAGVNVGATIVRASTAGRVGSRTVRPGQFVQAGTRMMSVVPLAGLYVIANFKETQIGLMRIGQPAHIEVDALPGVELRGHVDSLSPGTGAEFSILPPQNATGNFTKIVQRVPVRIAVDAGPAARRVLVPGLSVDVSVDTRSAKGAVNAIAAQEERREDR